MIQQLNPPIPVITPKGTALAHMVIDYGIEEDLQWVCFQDSNGECETWKSQYVRAKKNVTQGRDYISPFYHPSEVAFKKEEEDEEVQREEFEEECEEEDTEEDFDWKAAHDLVQKVNCELRKDLIDAMDFIEDKNIDIEELKNIIKDLIRLKNDSSD